MKIKIKKVQFPPPVFQENNIQKVQNNPRKYDCIHYSDCLNTATEGQNFHKRIYINCESCDRYQKESAPDPFSEDFDMVLNGCARLLSYVFYPERNTYIQS
jgi:hypothetical protein